MTPITPSQKAGIDLLKLLGWMALIASTAVWRGYVLSILWVWFIVRAFDAPPLSIPLAIGVSLIASFLTHQWTTEKRKTSLIVSMAIFGPAMTLLIGWIVTKFI
jgi:hypothetical protein